MTDTPPIIKPSSPMPYIWALVVLVLIGVVFVLAILYLRPQADFLVVITSISGLVATLFGLSANFIKNKETHDTVNSASTEKIAEVSARSHAEGMLKGAAEEQERIAKLAVMAAALAPSAPPTNGEPAPVKIVAAVPVPVKETSGGKS